MDEFGEWSQELDSLRTRLRSSSATNVNSRGDRDAARSLVQNWFRRVRLELAQSGVDEAELADLDARLQSLLRLAGGANRRSSYLTELEAARRLVPALEIRRELAYSSVAVVPPVRLSAIEERILRTLDQLIPSAALSYEQALRDLADAERVSFRGPANELRSVLWDVLERLAPDKDVMSATGFKLEPGQTKPTQKQKARFILRSRDLPTGARKAPETTIELVEAHVGTMARAVYDRSSISTHIQNARAEISQIKMYVDTVLAELLEIHRQ